MSIERNLLEEFAGRAFPGEHLEYCRTTGRLIATCIHCGAWHTASTRVPVRHEKGCIIRRTQSYLKVGKVADKVSLLPDFTSIQIGIWFIHGMGKIDSDPVAAVVAFTIMSALVVLIYVKGRIINGRTPWV